MLSKIKKQRVAKEVRVHETDTGSPEVQVAILSKKIEELAKHLKKNTRDKHSRRGLLGMVAKRQRHLNYLSKKNPNRYRSLTKKLGLKK
jgi:small subunit ribosomal protein S15